VALAHHPKKGEKQGPAMEPGVVRISNTVFASAGRVVDLPGVPDGRAGMCNRVGLLSRGWG